MYNIYLAEINEAKELTELAVRSEAYWDCDCDFMAKFKEIYKVTEEAIAKNPTFILSEDDRIIGFYELFLDSKEIISLEKFYIEPEKIGQGYGRILWKHLLDYCGERGIKEIQFVTSLQVTGFYKKMGALQVGDTESLLKKGRIIAEMRYML